MTMKRMALLAISCVAMALNASGQRPSNGAQLIQPMAYELYSWQESNGGWSFCVLASPSGPNVTVEQIFNKKFLLSGVKALKRNISGLPSGSTIFWLDRIVGAGQGTKGDVRLKYPLSQTIQDIKHYAETREVKVELGFDQKD
jgi:hypothetical protein